MATTKARIVVFDVGGVLINWNPENLYRKLIPDDSARRHFLSEVCPFSWNAQLDMGLHSWADAIAMRAQMFPDHADLIRAYSDRWPEMLSGAIDGTVAIKSQLRAMGVPVYGITNYSREKWAHSLELFPFLNEFEGVIVSAHERLMKPDPAIYQLLCTRYGLDPADCIYIDDLPPNVEAAEKLGMTGVVFTNPTALAQTLGKFFDLKAAA